MLEDDLSKKIYQYRVMYSLTGDSRYVDGLVSCTSSIVWLEDELKKRQGENIFLYGAGNRGIKIVKALGKYFTAIIDESPEKQNKKLGNLGIISLKEAMQNSLNPVIVVSVKVGNADIVKSLLQMGVAKENIINIGKSITDMIENNQYFDLQALEFGKDEIFVDCGAYDGDSTLNFCNWTANDFKHIYCFEMDRKNIERCYDNLQGLVSSNKCTIIERGTWCEKTQLKFSISEDVSSHVCDEGSEFIEVTTIDEELSGEKVSYIKMDIEGAELESLKGAKNIIKLHHPKLAICVYHKPDDIFTIPAYILSLWGGYRFYLRHYTFTEWDTVLYALPDYDSNVNGEGERYAE